MFDTNLYQRWCNRESLPDIALRYTGVTAESALSGFDQGYWLACAGVDAAFVTAARQRILQQLKSTAVSNRGHLNIEVWQDPWLPAITASKPTGVRYVRSE